MSTPIVAIDTETTGLDRRTREIWEIGMVGRDAWGRRWSWAATIEDVWISNADSEALEIGRFYERHPKFGGRTNNLVIPERSAASEVAVMIEGAHLIGAVPSFEDTGLFKLLDRYNLIPSTGRTPWHYHLIDVEALAVGYFNGFLAAQREENPVNTMGEPLFPPWNSEDLSRAVGVDPMRFDRHTALGDAKWALAIYDAVMGVE